MIDPDFVAGVFAQDVRRALPVIVAGILGLISLGVIIGWAVFA
jgi:hypothetical protein